jgi:predicted nucleotidyltransferase
VVEATRNLEETQVVYLGKPPLRIDLLAAIDGVAAADVLRRAVKATWDGLAFRVIALDDLIANKRAAGRPQDLADAAKLERVRDRRGGR